MRPTILTNTAALVALAALAAGCGSSTTPTATPSVGASTPSATRSAESGGGSTTSSPSAPHATEFNPPGDIPDDAVFVDHTARGSRVHFAVPEGWAMAKSGPVTTYTDKYNSISIEVRRRATAPTVASARKEDVAELRSTVSNVAVGDITSTTRQHGAAVHIAYLLDSPANPVTDKVVRDAAERFEFWQAGQEAILTLTGPQNADNVDPWQIVSDSLQWK